MESITTYYLYPSTIFASKTPHLVHTVLGSCVSVFLWDPVLCIGGVNHYMLPWWNGDSLASPKYGNIANDKLLEKMVLLGSCKKNLQAKVFGGAKQLDSVPSMFNVGENNIQLALDFLNEEKIPLISSSLGGDRGRKLKFFTETGEVLLKLL